MANLFYTKLTIYQTHFIPNLFYSELILYQTFYTKLISGEEGGGGGLGWTCPGGVGGHLWVGHRVWTRSGVSARHVRLGWNW
jgi:hypothetical protein